MTAMTVALLKAKGFAPDRKAGMGTAAVRSALENGQIDVYWEYTGTGLGVFYKITDKFPSRRGGVPEDQGARRRERHRLAQHVARQQHVRVRDEQGRRAKARHRDNERLREGGERRRRSSRSRRTPSSTRGRTACPGWQTAYGFEFDRENVKRMDTGLTYNALKDRQVDSAVVFATDGRIPAFNFVVLKDDKGYAAPYNLTPVVRKEILDKNPKIADALNSVAGEAQRRDDGEAQCQRRRRQEDAGGSGRRVSEGERADLRPANGRGRTRSEGASRSRTCRRSCAGSTSTSCPTRRSRARGAACSTSSASPPRAAGRARRRIAKTYAATQLCGSDRNARILFDGRRAGLAGAAFAGAATIDSLDAHDGHVLTKGHAGVAVLPALLALIDGAQPGEAAADVDGREFLACLVLGYEIATRAGIALHSTARDYHCSGAWNALGCAAIAARASRARSRAHAPRARHRRILRPARADPARLRLPVDGEGRLRLGRARRRQRSAARARGLHRRAGVDDRARRRCSVLRRSRHALAHLRAVLQGVSGVPVGAACDRGGARAAARARHVAAEDIAEIAIESFREAVALGSQCAMPRDDGGSAVQPSVSRRRGARLRTGRRGRGRRARARRSRAWRGSSPRRPRPRTPEFSDRFPAERWARVRITLGDGRALVSHPARARGNPENPLERRRAAREVSRARNAGSRRRTRSAHRAGGGCARDSIRPRCRRCSTNCCSLRQHDPAIPRALHPATGCGRQRPATSPRTRRRRSRPGRPSRLLSGKASAARTSKPYWRPRIRQRMPHIARVASRDHHREGRRVVVFDEQRVDVPDEALRAGAGRERARMEVERATLGEDGSGARPRNGPCDAARAERRTARRRPRSIASRFAHEIRRAARRRPRPAATNDGPSQSAVSAADSPRSCWARSATRCRTGVAPRRRTTAARASPCTFHAAAIVASANRDAGTLRAIVPGFVVAIGHRVALSHAVAPRRDR